MWLAGGYSPVGTFSFPSPFVVVVAIVMAIVVLRGGRGSGSVEEGNG